MLLIGCVAAALPIPTLQTGSARTAIEALRSDTGTSAMGSFTVGPSCSGDLASCPALPRTTAAEPVCPSTQPVMMRIAYLSSLESATNISVCNLVRTGHHNHCVQAHSLLLPGVCMAQSQTLTKRCDDCPIRFLPSSHSTAAGVWERFGSVFKCCYLDYAHYIRSGGGDSAHNKARTKATSRY